MHTSRRTPHITPPEINTTHHTPTQVITAGYTPLPLPDLLPTEIRVLSHNINTLPTSSMAELSASFDLYRNLDPTILGLQETNKNWAKYDATLGRLKQCTERRWPGTKITTAQCPDEAFTGPAQPGGVAQMILRQLTARVTKHGTDPLGRYAWQEILLDGNRNLLVITAYRVVQSRTKGCGPTTSMMQQWRKLRASGIDNPNPRKQLLTDLIAFVKPHVDDGNEVLIMMDANDSIHSAPMDHFMDELNLCDLMSDHLPPQPPTTYQRGRNKIDHIVGTMGIHLATVRAYVLPFGPDSPKSDHAICGIDFSLDILSGIRPESLYDPTHPAARRLWSTDVKAASRYVKLVERRCLDDNISQRINTLIQRCKRTGECSDQDICNLNGIDENLTEIMLWAEIKCKNARGHDWSPLLETVGRTVIAAKWNLSNIIHGRTPIPNHISKADAIQTAKQQITETYEVLRQVQNHARQIRETFLEDRAEHLAETRDITKATALRELLAAERSSSIFKRLGYWFKGKEYTTMDRMMIPDNPDDLMNTTWSTVIEAQALFEVLTKDCVEHFYQAADTPFVTGPVADRIGPFDDNEYCDAVLNGTFDFDDAADITEVHELIKGMRYPDPSSPTPLINTTIDEESFISTIAHTRERTSSSPSGRHYGHYRSLLRSPETLGMIASLADFCFAWGVTMKRWEKVIQPQIPKDNGTPRITRIRRITLIEADLNMCLSELFGRRLMDNAERHQLLHPHQFGSRKGRMSISAVLLKRLSYDLIRQTRMNAIVFDNDARACYDRMIPSQSAIISRRAGMTRAAARTFLRVLLRMEYYVRTAYGIASESYSNLIKWLLGVMQGAGHSGGLWALTSSIMLDLMASADGATFHSPYPLCPSSHRHGEAFVDDTTLWTLSRDTMFNTLVTQMSMTAQRWERLLYSTGGALNLLKCFWYGVQWAFSDAGVPRMMKTQDDDLPIQLTSGADFQTKHSVNKIEVTKGLRTLGVRLAPNGSDNDEYNHRMAEATTMRDRLKCAPLNREQVGIGFRSIWKMKLQYPIGVTCFTHKQCNKLQARYLPSFLSRMGINRTTAAAVRHGPQTLGGMDVFHLETEQAVQHTKLIVSHFRRQDEIGQMLRLSIDHLQLQAGTSWPVLSRCGKKVRMYVDPCYVSHTWGYLDGIGCHLHLEPDTWMHPQRQQDSFIMDDVTNLPGIKPIEIVHVQRVRLYLGVTTKADISTSDGTALCDWALKVTDNPRPTVFRFPRQDRPRAAYIIATWTRIIRLCYAQHDTCRLDAPLGDWHTSRIRQVWDTVIDPESGIVYRWKDGIVRQYEIRSRNQYQFRRTSNTNSFPIHCVPISGRFQSGLFVTSGHTRKAATPTPPPTPDPMQLMIRGVLINCPRKQIAKAIWSGKAIMGTDGSVRNPSATYSFVISLSQDNVALGVKGGGYLPPTAQYLDPYSNRTEAAALLAGLTWIQHLLTQFPNHTNTAFPPLPIAIDNKNVVTDANRIITPLLPVFDLLQPDFDIMQAVRALIASLPITTQIFHVKAHQDRSKPWAELDSAAKINVLADTQASHIYQLSPRLIGIFPTWVPGTAAALFHNDRQVTKDIPAYIRAAKHTPIMRSYHIRRSKEGTGREKSWSEATYDSIDWQHYGESFRRLSIGRKIQISKYTNDLLPTRRRIQTLDNREDGRCFACERLWEDTSHVLTCSCEARCPARKDARMAFKLQLTRLHTPDVMSNLLCDSMDSWLDRRPVQFPVWDGPREPIHGHLRRAFQAQSRIGWDQFFRGRIASEWRRPIDTYYRIRQPGEYCTPDHWMRTVITALWKFSIQIWKQRNTELHGTDSAISLERRRKEAADAAINAYQQTLGKIPITDSYVLHHASIDELLQWNKQQLDAYLNSADIIIEQRDEPD